MLFFIQIDLLIKANAVLSQNTVRALKKREVQKIGKNNIYILDDGRNDDSYVVCVLYVSLLVLVLVQKSESTRESSVWVGRVT